MDLIDQLITLSRIYGDAERLKTRTVSWRAFGDSKKLAALHAGAEIQVGRALKTIQWFSDHWPADAVWPPNIPRPAPSQEAAE